MGKRSDFPRSKRDLYRTVDLRAVPPLLPHLMAGTKYYEPCAAYGDLIAQLDDAGHRCQGAADIEPKAKAVAKRDALALTFNKLPNCDAIITNPPWTRALLHPMIITFSSLRPTWLLFDSDWMHTEQAAPYLKRCKMIVSVGRLRWFPNSEFEAKDNASWYLFDYRHHGRYTQFVGRNAIKAG